MLHLVILLLASGCVSCETHREYFPINEDKSWDEAQSYCRQNYTDLATVGSHDDMKRLVERTAVSGVTEQIWIGLKETVETSWLWSVGETQTSQGLVEHTNWAGLPDSSHHCGGMGADGKWLSALCETELPFVCQEGEGPDVVYKVVLQDKTWRQAQEYCRVNHTDLASVMSQTENQAIQQMITNNVPSLSLVWIGLFRDGWKWSDKSNSSFRSWTSSQPNDDGICTLYSPSVKKWYDRDCSNKHPFCCYIAMEKRERKIVRVEVKLDSHEDFSDSAVSEAILKQLQQNYEEVKFQWRVQPDGKIFHNKEKKKISKAC